MGFPARRPPGAPRGLYATKWDTPAVSPAFMDPDLAFAPRLGGSQPRRIRSYQNIWKKQRVWWNLHDRRRSHSERLPLSSLLPSDYVFRTRSAAQIVAG